MGRIGFELPVLSLVTVMVVVLTPLVLWLLVRGPEALGLGPNGDAPAPRASETAAGRGAPPTRDFMRTWHFWSVALPFALGLTAQISIIHSPDVLSQAGVGDGGRYVACVMFGLGVGNTTSLPSVIVQAEFPKAAFGQVVSTIIAINQFTYSFGPGLLGWLRDGFGSYDAAFAVCLMLQLAAAAILLFGGARRSESATSMASA